MRAFTRSLALLSAALLTGLYACNSNSSTQTEDPHHVQGTEWADSTGIFTIHFNSPEEVQLRLNHEDSPMGELKYDIPCHFAGDTLYIDDYSKTTPFGRVAIIKNFKGLMRGTSISASFTTSNAEVAPGGHMPTFTEVPLQSVLFTKKAQ